VAGLLYWGHADGPRPRYFVAGSPQHDMAEDDALQQTWLASGDRPCGGADSNNLAVLVLAAYVQLYRDTLP
jgi:hypothetical protein